MYRFSYKLFTRFKLALTEDKPVIKPYMENLWSRIRRYKTSGYRFIIIHIGRFTSSLDGFVGKYMTSEDYHRIFVHPEHNNEISLYTALATYDWHCNHHLGHIQLTLQK